MPVTCLVPLYLILRPVGAQTKKPCRTNAFIFPAKSRTQFYFLINLTKSIKALNHFIIQITEIQNPASAGNGRTTVTA